MKRKWLLISIFLVILLFLILGVWYFFFRTPQNIVIEEEIKISAQDAKDFAKDALFNVLKNKDYALYLEGQEERYEFYAKDSDGNILAKCEIDKQTGEAYIYDYTSVGSGGNTPGKTE